MRVVVGIAISACALSLVGGSPLTAQQDGPAQRVTAAANAFLTTLDASQRQRVMFAFDDERSGPVGRTFRPAS